MGLTSFLISVVCGLIANELYAWAPCLSRFLVRLAVRRLPQHLRNRYDEEWSAELEYIPGGLSQLAFAISIQRAASGLISAEHALAEVGGRFKRVGDKILAGCMVVWLFPLLLLIALAIRLDSSGPILFRQKRYGFNNQEIVVYKFRSMHHNRPREEGVPQATKNDRRVTRIGRILRSTSLDELPQLFNVLQGNMSMVGPRPHAVEHNEQYAQLIGGYHGRHRVKPGITGWAQINGFRGETDTVEKMRGRVEYDIFYIENWSLWIDLEIMMLTTWAGFTMPNAPDNSE